jgi:hypothetical protein
MIIQSSSSSFIRKWRSWGRGVAQPLAMVGKRGRSGRKPKANAAGLSKQEMNRSLSIRRTFTYSKKLEILRHWDEVGDIEVVLDRFFKDLTGKSKETKRKNLYAWRSNRHKIENKASTPSGAKRVSPQLSLRISRQRFCLGFEPFA